MSWISYIALSAVLIEIAIGQEVICPTIDGYYPHPVDCDKYYRCVNGEGTEFKCAPETFWSSQTLVCSWKDDVTDCDSYGKRLRQSAYRSSDIEVKKTDNGVDGVQQQTSDDLDQGTGEPVTLTTDSNTAMGSDKTTYSPTSLAPSSNASGDSRPHTTHSPAAFVASGQSSTASKLVETKAEDPVVTTNTRRVTSKITNQPGTTNVHTATTTNDDHTATIQVTDRTASVNVTIVTQKPSQANASSNPVPMKFAARNLFSDFKCPKYFGFFRDPYNCRAYYHCLNGIPYKRHCPSDQYYDQNIFNCGPKSSVQGCLYYGIPGSDIEFRSPVAEGVTGFRCPKDNGYYPDTDDCSYYYECILGHAYKRQCMVGTLFDRIRHKCTWENLVRDCAKLTTASTDTTTKVTNKIDYSFHCPKPDGYFRSLSDCRVYYHCIDNRAIVYQCTPGSLFDIHLGKCTWFSRVYDCNEDGKPVSMDGRKQKEKNIPKKPVKSDDTVISYRSFKCPTEEGYFRDAEDCAVYYFCTKWKVFQQQCKPGTVFSMEKLTCTWPSNVDCNTTRTAAPSTVRATNSLPLLTTASPHRQASRDETRSTNTIRLENKVTGTNSPTTAIQQRDQNYDYGYYYDNENQIDNGDNGDDGKNLPDINSITEAASISFVCPPVFDGYYGDPISCTKFYRCIGGKMYSFSCPTGTFFDNTRYICNFVSEVNDCTSDGIRYSMIQQQRDEYKKIEPKFRHSHSEQKKVEFIEPKSRRVHDNHDKENRGESSFDRMPPGFKAVKLPCPLRDGVFGHPKSCTKFIFCKKFIPYIIDCPGDLVYNIHLHTCDYPDNVICKRYD